MRTRTTERIRIRDRSGLIKGPFKRAEISSLIRQRKIDGEEEIFLESEGKWKPIASDTEFFDLIQEVLFGIKTATQTGVKNKDGVWTNSFEDSENSNIDRTEKLPTTQLRVQITGATQFPRDKVLSDNERDVFLADIEKEQQEKSPINYSKPAEDFAAYSAQTENKELRSFEDIAATEKKRSFKGLPFFVLGLVIVFGVISLLPDSRLTDRDLSNIKLDFNFKKGYFRPLLLRLRLLSPIEAPPKELQNDTPSIKVLPLNLHDLMLKEEESARKPELRVNASTWVYKAWTYRILADVVSTGDIQKGNELRGASEAILFQLSSKGVLSQEIKTLFASLDFLLEGEVGKSFEELKKLKERSLAAEIYSREISYWATLGGAVNATSSPLAFEDLSELSLKYQYEEELRQKVTKDDFAPDFIKAAENSLAQDAHSLITWYLISKYYAEKYQGGPAVTNRYFFTGLCQLSLWPRTLQAMYWRTYAQFLEKNGSNDAERLSTSADLIEVGEYDNNVASVDIDDPIFRFKSLLENYRKAFEQNEMNPIELASFEILSEASPDAKNNLVSVLISPLLDKNWGLAERRLRMVEKTFPFDADVKTLRVWLEGERFQFEKAQQILSEAFGSGTGNEYQRAEGILYVLGRDYDGGLEILKNYQEKNAQDSLTLFFIARASMETEKYTDCVRFAQLALMNSTGPLRLRSQTMNYRCRVLAQLGVDDAVREFSQFVSQFPYNSISREEYVRALMDADRSQEAIKIAEKQVVEHPDSASLKILLGEVFEKRGALNEALALYNEARKIEPRNVKASIRVGDLFFKDRRYKEAGDNYATAGVIDEEYPELFLKAARAYRKAGNFDQAQEKYTKEIKLRPAVLDTFLEAAEFLLESNRPSGVPDLFGQFSETFRSDSRVLTRLAQAYFAMGDKKNARLNAELAVKQSPTEAEPYRILGALFDAEGQYPLAKSNYEKYLVLVPNAPEAEMLKKKLSMPPY